MASFARAFTTALWDARVHLGWSVRTLAEAAAAAREDTDLRTALLDARRIAGDGRLWSRAERSLLVNQRTRDADGFVRAKTQELRARREKFGETVFLLEPNVKNGQGGLRDLEAALWVAQVRFHARTLGQVLERGMLPRHDVAEARAARDFLLRVRHSAHLASGRKEDRLTFELQDKPRAGARLPHRPRGRGRRALHASRLPGGGHAAARERCAAGPRRGGADAAAHLPARAQGGPLQGVPGTPHRRRRGALRAGPRGGGADVPARR